MTAMRTTGHDAARLVTGHHWHASLPGVYFLALSHSRGKPWPLFITTSDALPASGSRPIHAAAPRGKRAKAADTSTAASPASRKRIHPVCARCGARLSRYLLAPRGRLVQARGDQLGRHL